MAVRRAADIVSFAAVVCAVGAGAVNSWGCRGWWNMLRRLSCMGSWITCIGSESYGWGSCGSGDGSCGSHCCCNLHTLKVCITIKASCFYSLSGEDFPLLVHSHFASIHFLLMMCYDGAAGLYSIADETYGVMVKKIFETWYFIRWICICWKKGGAVGPLSRMGAEARERVTESERVISSAGKKSWRKRECRNPENVWDVEERE